MTSENPIEKILNLAPGIEPEPSQFAQEIQKDVVAHNKQWAPNPSSLHYFELQHGSKRIMSWTHEKVSYKEFLRSITSKKMFEEMEFSKPGPVIAADILNPPDHREDVT